MDDTSDVLIRLTGVVKDYRSLRPLRDRELTVPRGASIALMGFDAAAAEVLVNLLTGGVVPDEGEVRVFGEPTASISDRDSWLRMLDRFGLISDRSVLLEQLTAEQNLAMPLSLAVESMADPLRARVRRLAAEVGVPDALVVQPLGTLSSAMRLRIRLGRALALDPEVVLAEHPNATLDRADASAFARDLGVIARSRGAATLTMTADARFAHEIADQVLALDPATGLLKPPSGWKRWRFLSC